MDLNPLKKEISKWKNNLTLHIFRLCKDPIGYSV